MYKNFKLTATIPHQSELFTAESSYEWMLGVYGDDFLRALDDYITYDCPIILPFRIGSYVGEGIFEPIEE